MKHTQRPRLALHEYVNGIVGGDRIILSQAITLIESTRHGDRELARELMRQIVGHSGKSVRVGITGVPGVGKSTFIETFGTHLTSLQKKVAVLSIDPSSPISHGSILGDKTRMSNLARDPLAFIRPTAAGDTLGGVAQKTREVILLCEAAGFDVVLVETVGVGQSEVAIKNLTDFFLLLMLAGAGDELQGLKKGITELADAIAITKADGDNVLRARAAQAEYQHALHLQTPPASGWHPKVMTTSAIDNIGIDMIWKMINEHHSLMRSNGFLEKIRTEQNLHWMNEHFHYLLQQQLHHDQVYQRKAALEKSVAEGLLSSVEAAEQLMAAYVEIVGKSKS